MVKKPFKGNYLEAKVRFSYDRKTDSIHVTSTDKDLQGPEGFHLALNGGRSAEYIIRQLMEREGLIPKERFKPNVTHVPFEDDPDVRSWNEFPLGEFADGEAVWDVNKSPNILIAGSAGTGKSVIQRNIIFHCLQHPDKWRFLGIDLKRVELSPFIKYDPTVMGIATNVADGGEMVRYVQNEMLRRYSEMEEIGVHNFQDLTNPPPAIMLMIDETYAFLATSGIKTNEAREEDSIKGEAAKTLGEIARLGRAAGIHLVLATQRPDPSVFYGEFRQNIPARIAAGRMDSIASALTLDNDNATRLPAIKGRGYFQINGEGADFQAYFAPQDWYDKKLETSEEK